jgi:hypothetical protein
MRLLMEQERRLRSTLLAGLGGGVLVAGILFAWFQLAHRLVWGSGYADLPGENTYGSVAKAEAVVLVLAAFIGGFITSLMCRSLRWLAALVAALPLFVLVAASQTVWSWWYMTSAVMALAGAYATDLTARATRQANSEA